MIKKAFTVLLAAGLLALTATPALAASDDKDKGKIELKTRKTAAVVEGDTAWVAISWKAKYADATEFKITVETEDDDVTIVYPANTATYSSLMDNDTLSTDEIDFTSLQVSMPYDSKKIKLKVTATWVQNGEDHEEDFKVDVPVAKFKGDDIAQATKDAGPISAASPAWLGVEWTGLAPSLDDVEMTVSGPAGAAITYPGERAFTSLYYDSTLEDGETDVARFLVDVAAMAPGDYSFEVELSYAKAGKTESVTGVVSFEVTG